MVNFLSIPDLEWTIICLAIFLWLEGAVLIAGGLYKLKYLWIGIGLCILSRIIINIPIN